jgi:hypothetical protein
MIVSVMVMTALAGHFLVALLCFAAAYVLQFLIREVAFNALSGKREEKKW